MADLVQPAVRLIGRLDRFIYRDEARGFGIAVLLGDNDRQVIKGSIWGIEEGERVEVVGRWVDDPQYGRQLQVETLRPLLPATAAGIAEHIAHANISGVGSKVAARIVALFGDQTLQVIRDHPERLREVHGIGAKRARSIADRLREQLARADSHVYLHGLGLGGALVRRIFERFGEDAVRTVRDKPYELARTVVGIGFRTADRIARSQGVQSDAPERIDAGVLHALDEEAGRGHTAPGRRRVMQAAASILSCKDALVERAIARLIERGAVRDVRISRHGATGADGRWHKCLAMRHLHRAELELAGDLERLAASHSAPLADEEVKARLKLAAAALGFGLEGTQRAAVIEALHAGLMVITGGPGTGKTTIILGLLAAMAPDTAHIALAAPTGRAARRLTETTLREASTVHRLLEYDPHEHAFGRNREHPLGAELVIIDESSMLDVNLAAGLCAAIKPGGRLLIVGDADQLPSVGPGSVLGDVIGAEKCPIVRLDHIYRQAHRSLIVENAHRVRIGELPIGAEDARGDFFVINRDEPDAIMATLLEIVCQRLPARYGFDPVDDIQVLVPVHKGPLGTQAFNRELRLRLNPDGADVGGGFRIGDKIIQIRNNYDLDVQNGDVGRIEAKVDEGLQVQLGGRTVIVPRANLVDLQLAYAISVHKSQGSEHPAIVMPLHGDHRLLLQRNLLYTAITRARRFAVLIGPRTAIASAVANASASRRHTLLGARLLGELRDPGAADNEDG